MMGKNRRDAFRLFIASQVMTFGFITLAQFVEKWLFALALLLMHGGIVLFILSKRMFKKEAVPVTRHYQASYICLAGYLPVLIDKLLGFLLGYTPNASFIFVAIIVITAISIVIGVINSILLERKLRQKT
jgi:dipeptide/tripeptide permease